jgi:RHS repeat-associated protein
VTETTDYIGPFVYKNNVLDYIVTSNGRVVFSGGNFSYYEFHVKDHLGNVRTAFKKSASSNTAEVLQKNDYYPFGLLMAESSDAAGTTSKNRYKYNGKEFVPDSKMGWYDYGARMYDPQLGWWHSVDPLAEERSWVSPYNFVQNNPLNRIDPDGMLDDWVERDNQVVWDENVTSTNDADLKSGDKYLGKEGYGVNTETGASIHYKSDGTTSEGSFSIGEATVTGIMSDHARTMSNPVVQAIHQGQEDFLNHPVTKATVNTLLFVATGGIEGVTALGGAAVRSIGNIKVPIYRVFGGEARAIGNYWSPINPKLYGSQYRNLAGLPNSNTGAFTLKATTPLRNINPSTIKPAAPLDGNFGRLVPELKVFDKGSVVVKDFWVNF